METSPAPSVKTILLVDDNDAQRLTNKWFLSSFGYEVDCARNAEEALALFNPRMHDVVVTDNSMPGMSGLEMAHIMKMRSPSTPIVMYTGTAPKDRSCVDAVIQKPAHPLALRVAVDQILQDK